ncbi:MAG: aminoacyltransferase [Bacilli bacterium]|nr:aminoacyltransferase [Bacilli bacterium]
MNLEICNDYQEFNSFVLKNNPTNIMQTSYWAKVKEGDWQAHYLLIKDNNIIKASAMLLQRHAFGKYSLFYCPRGIICDYKDENVIEESLKLLKEYVTKNNGFVLRFDPEIAYSIKDCRTLEELANNKDTYNRLTKYARSTGLNKDMDASMQPRFQMVVNLKEDLKSKIKSKKRRLVNDTYLSKRGYEIYINNTIEGVTEFARLSHLTELKQKVALRNEEYFMKMFNAFNKDHLIDIYMAKVNMDELISYAENDENEKQRLIALKEELGNVVNTNAIICIYGTNMVQMFYGASDERLAKYKAGYKLHYQAMEDAKKKGYEYFNMGGVSGHLDDGLFHFKSEFHAELWEYIGDFDVVCNSFIYFLFTKALPIYKKLRH